MEKIYNYFNKNENISDTFNYLKIMYNKQYTNY